MKKNKKYFIFLALITLQACETAFETDLSGKKIILLAPVNNLVTVDSTHTFYWEQLKGASQYRLQVVSPRFDSIVKLIEDTTINADRFKITKLNTGMYQWKVRAMNEGSTSEASDTWNLKIQ